MNAWALDILFWGLTVVGMLWSLKLVGEDLRSRLVTAWKLYLWMLLMFLTGAVDVMMDPGRGWNAFLLGGLVGVGLGQGVSALLKRRLQQDALGSGDVLALGAGGAMLGIGLLGVWVLTACLIALALWILPSRWTGKNVDPLDNAPRLVLPFFPSLLGALWALWWIKIFAGPWLAPLVL